MSSNLPELLGRLDAVAGVSGDESAVAELIVAELAGHHDRHESDALGNHFFVRTGPEGAPSVMLCAHMDELGFIVQHIEDEGFVRIAPIGFHDDRMVIDQDLRIHGRKGPVDGVTGAKPAHVITPEEAKQAIPLDQMFVDVGTSSRAETERLGVRVGDTATFARAAGMLNGTRVFTGKAVDDRSGCAVMIEVMRRLGPDVGATVWATAAVQEEVGIRGAGPAAARIVPDVALAIDVTLCGDTPGIEFSRLPIRLGNGPAVKYFDWAPAAGYGSAVPRRLTNRLEEVAESAGISYQREVLMGGATDAWGIALSGTGVLTGCISVPSRYIHSAVGCINVDDVEGAIQLIVAFIENVAAHGVP
jgi:putative aminopeptidase FrvX